MKISDIDLLNECWENKVPAIEQFLQDYKTKSIEYFTGEIDKYYMEREIAIRNLNSVKACCLFPTEEERIEYEKKIVDYTTFKIRCGWDHKYNGDSYDKYTLQHEITYNALGLKYPVQGYYADVQKFVVNCSKEKAFEKLEKDINVEIRIRRADLIHRIQTKIGKIVDMKYINIGNDGSLNGLIIGEKGKAQVDTISAGGYNIQRFHYRVLVKLID